MPGFKRRVHDDHRGYTIITGVALLRTIEDWFVHVGTFIEIYPHKSNNITQGTQCLQLWQHTCPIIKTTKMNHLYAFVTTVPVVHACSWLNWQAMISAI